MTPKQYLSQHRQIDNEITAINEEMERLRELSTKTSNPLSGMPSGGGKNAAPYEDIVHRIIEIERQRNRKISELLILKVEIEGVIAKVDDIRLRSILRDKYINGLTLEQIAVNHNYSWRHLRRLHGEALSKIKVPGRKIEIYKK